MWRLCHFVQTRNHTFEYPSIGDDKMVDEESCEVVQSGGQSGNY